MKIIRMGNINTYTNTCPMCSCQYEYDDTDVQTGHDYSSTGIYGYVLCPCCHNMNRVTYSFKENYSYPYMDPLTRYGYTNCYSDKELYSDMHNIPLKPDIKCEAEDQE